MINTTVTTPVVFHCIKCGKTWGEGLDIESHGLCIECFSEWAKAKKPCFGTELVLTGKDGCSLHQFCGEYYEFKQDLQRRL